MGETGKSWQINVKLRGDLFALIFRIKNDAVAVPTHAQIYTKIKNILSKISRNLVADWTLWLDGNTH